MNWLREAISDEDGQGDMAYVAIGACTIGALATLLFVCVMAGLDYLTCAPITTLARGETDVASIVPCRFDPLPIGQAAGLIFAAFAGLIGALAGYMAATRRRERKPGE